MQVRTAVFLMASSVLMLAASPAIAQRAPQIVAEDAMVPSGDPGIDIYVRNKHPAGMLRFESDRTLVFVHGATYPASTSFDLELGGLSFMDYLASRGFDVYALDLPGYGKSSRPAQMAQPADANPPFENTADAIRHYGTVVDYVLRRRGLQKVDAMGWSWGTTIVAGFSASQPAKVERLVLYAPIWIVQGASVVLDTRSAAYRSVTPEQAKQRWFNGVPADKQEGLIPSGWFDAWQKATWATDPESATKNPPTLRAPNGVVQDIQTHWRAGKSTYDPAKIIAPALLVQGEWDHDTPPYMSQTLFPLIINAPWKRYVEIGEGTHTIMMEKNRGQLFAVVGEFLTEPNP